MNDALLAVCRQCDCLEVLSGDHDPCAESASDPFLPFSPFTRHPPTRPASPRLTMLCFAAVPRAQTKAAISGTAAQFGELREVGLGSFTTPVGLIQNMVEICRSAVHSSGLTGAGPRGATQRPWRSHSHGTALSTCDTKRLAEQETLARLQGHRLHLEDVPKPPEAPALRR